MEPNEITYLTILPKNLKPIEMKIEKYALAENLLLGLMPKFKGLSEKSAKKMIDKLDKTAFNLSNIFFKLQKKDYLISEKKEKKAIKIQKKEAKKALIKEKINLMLGTEKPKNMIAIPEKTLKKQSKKPVEKPVKIKLS